MLTPKFEVSQDSHCVVVEIWLTGLCRLDQAEATVEDDTLLFTCEPYFLRLHLTGPCVDSDDAADAQSLRCRSFDADTGALTLLVKKAEPGCHFPDLDMLTGLLAGPAPQRRQQAPAVLVQELLSAEEPPSCQAAALELDWFVEPEEPPGPAAAAAAASLASHVKGGLGFAFRRRDEQSAAMLQGLDHLLPGLVSMSHAERLAAKEAQEAAQFDPDYYLADLHEPPELLQATLAQPQPPSLLTPPMEPEERQARLLALPRRPQLEPDEWELRACLMSLADLLFAYCLDWRVCEGEQGSESARSVLTQAACLSCQCPLVSVPQLLRSCYRRALCYGLLRSWRLCQLVARDAARLLGNKESTLRCLLRLERLFACAEGFAAANHLLLADTCVWLQRCPQSQLAALSQSLLAGVEAFRKEDAGLELAEWELAASMQAAEIA